MRLLRLVVLTLLTPSVILVTASAPPAFACSCAFLDTADHVTGADEVYAGTLVEMTEPPRTGVVSSGDPITYTVEVDAVFRGAVGAVAEFESAMSGASCGLEGMVVDRRYVVFTQADGPRRIATSCGGTATATPRLEKAVERLAGARNAPDRAVALPGSVDPSSTDDVSDDSTSALAVGVVTLLAIGAVAGAGLVLRRRGVIGERRD